MTVNEERDPRQAFPVGEGTRIPIGPGDAPAAASFDSTRLDFGHYAGRTIAELAESDPDYLRWLARRPSGARYRGEISRVMGALPLVDPPKQG